MTPTVIVLPNPHGTRHYFDNNAVEDVLTRYVQTGCTNLRLRDAVMAHAEPLIRRAIRTFNLNRICPNSDHTVDDFVSLAWIQIERSLYKYRARPHCGSCFDQLNPGPSALYTPANTEYGILTPEDVAGRRLACPLCKSQPTTIVYRGVSKVFNMWTQIARTSILAFIKKEKAGIKHLQLLHSMGWKSGMERQRKKRPTAVVARAAKPVKKPTAVVVRSREGRSALAHVSQPKEPGLSSQFDGVSWNKRVKRWRAEVQGTCLGHFIAEEDAARAYDVAAFAIWGTAAILNFPRA